MKIPLATVDNLACPECGQTMYIRRGAYRSGWYYACRNYPACKGTHGAHPDGRPLGAPANAATKKARIAAHAAFDYLWNHAEEMYASDHRKLRKPNYYRNLARFRAYTWLSRQLGMTTEECHIALFDEETCEQVISLCQTTTAQEIRAWHKSQTLRKSA